MPPAYRYPSSILLSDVLRSPSATFTATSGGVTVFFEPSAPKARSVATRCAHMSSSASTNTADSIGEKWDHNFLPPVSRPNIFFSSPIGSVCMLLQHQLAASLRVACVGLLTPVLTVFGQAQRTFS